MMTDQATAHPSERHNLPQPTTSFIGRADEVRAVRHLFERHRLVTLAGPGGAVKDPPAART